MTLPITVCIPVLNEEGNLSDCLAAVGDHFEEVVVVDSHSRDRTAEIAEAAGAKVLQFDWDGKFPKKRNWVLNHYSFNTPWVMFLDADERVTADFLQELHATLQQTDCAAFRISFNNRFLDRWLLHGDVFRKLALFRVGVAEYERIPEDTWSHLDMEIHEHPIVDGPIGEIGARLEHHGYHGPEHFFEKHDAYSSWEAHRYLWLNQAGDEEWSKLNKRQQFKYRNLEKRWLGLFYFLISVAARRGILDGAAGWTFARLKRKYFDDIRRKIGKLRNHKASSSE